MNHKRSILYLVSRFPNIPETFVVNEWWAIAESFDMELASLVRMNEQTLHAQTARLLPEVHFASLLAPSTVAANLRQLRRQPRRYLRTFGRVTRGSFRRPNGGVVKGAVAFWKAAQFAEIAEQRIDHVHAHFVSHSATAAWVISELTGVPFSITAHANDLYVRPALLDEKLADAEFVVTISDYNREFIRTHCPTSRPVELVHCGVDTDIFSFRPRTGHSRLVCVARLETTKGQGDLLRAFAIARRELPELTLDLIGDGADRASLERLSHELEIADGVRFVGALPTQQVRKALDDLDIFVLPSLRHPSGRMDGIPVALMEAMASGLPVVTTRLSGIPELVIDGETGLLVPPESPNELAAAILRLAGDDQLAQRLALNARRRVTEQFDLATETARLASLFAASIEARNGSARERAA